MVGTGRRRLRLACLALSIAALFGVPAIVAAQTDPAAAKQLFGMVNKARADAGLPPLQWDDRLAHAALEHTKRMAEEEEVTHQFSGEPVLGLRLAQTTIRLDRSGENVAFDSGMAAAHNSLMHSPGHRANILNPDYNAIGIGVVLESDYYYMTQDFARRLPELTVSQAEDEMAASFEQSRKSAGSAPLRRLDAKEVRKEACAMAKRDVVRARSVSIPDARLIITFTISNPSKLPSDVLNLRKSRDYAGYAVGACFQRSQSYPSGVFWTVMAFYSKGRTD